MASLEGDNLVVFCFLCTSEVWPDKRGLSLLRETIYYYLLHCISLHLGSHLLRGMSFGERDFIRGMSFGERYLIRGVSFHERGFIRGVSFGERYFIRGGTGYIMYLYIGISKTKWNIVFDNTKKLCCVEAKEILIYRGRSW